MDTIMKRADGYITAINNAVRLEDLPEDKLEQIARATIYKRYVEEADRQSRLAEFDPEELERLFISEKNSEETKRKYAYCFSGWKMYLNQQSVKMFDARRIHAERFIETLKFANKSARTIRLFKASLSALYEYFERITEGQVLNIWRGLKMPKMEIVNKNKFYAEEITPRKLDNVRKDMEAVIAHYAGCNGIQNKRCLGAMLLMKYAGIRIGAIANIRIIREENLYFAESKGKTISGVLSDDFFEESDRLGADYSFADTTYRAIEEKIRRDIVKMRKAGKVVREYTVHDFRHLFAITEYERSRDIYRVSKLLNHASIGITEQYLKGLGLIA